jgi:hypothetical protein
MTIEFTVENQTGQSGKVDANYVLTQLQGAGYNPQGVSADGQTLTLHDDQGPYEVKTADALKNLGWNVRGAAPLQADYNNIQMGWRAAVNKLPDDASRRAYIEGQARNLGHQEIQVLGSGRDWYIFNPQTNQWMGVTNNPEWDMSDLVEAGLEAPRAIASAVGGGVGAVSGAGTPASLALGAAGAGLAGGAVDASERALLAAFDPQYREQVRQNAGATAADVGFGAGLDAATMGIAKGAPMALGFLKPELGAAASRLVNNGIASSATKGLGASMEAGGAAVKGLAGALDNPLGRDLATLAMPGVGDASGLGLTMQLPSMATRGGARGLGSLGEAEWMRNLNPELAQKMRLYSAGLLAKSPAKPGFAQALQEGAEEFAGRASTTPGLRAAPAAAEADSADIMEKLFRDAAVGASKRAPRAVPHASGLETIEEAGQRALEDTTRRARIGQTAGRVGRAVGRGMENAATVGRGLEKGAGAVVGGALKGARAAGAATQRTGQALRALGTAAAPIENRALGRFAAEEAYGPSFEEWNPLRRRDRRYTMDPELAQK